MTPNPTVEVPKDVTDLLSNPDNIINALKLLNALLNPRFTAAVPGLIGGAVAALTVTFDGAEFTLAIRYPAGVPLDLPSTATLPEVIAALNKHSAGQRAIQGPVAQA